MDKIEKVNENTIKRVRTIDVVQNYDYDFLKRQLVQIQKQKDEDNAKRDAEIQEVMDLISQADSLGVIARVDKIESVADAIEEPILDIKK